MVIYKVAEVEEVSVEEMGSGTSYKGKITFSLPFLHYIYVLIFS